MKKINGIAFYRKATGVTIMMFILGVSESLISEKGFPKTSGAEVKTLGENFFENFKLTKFIKLHILFSR